MIYPHPADRLSILRALSCSVASERLFSTCRSAEGVPVDDGMWAEVLNAGELFGVTEEELEAIIAG